MGPPYGAASRRSVSATQSSSVAQSVGVNTLAKAACTSSTGRDPTRDQVARGPHLACDCGGVADQNGAAEIGGDNGRGGHGNKLLDVGLPERDGLRGGVVH